MPVRQTTRNRSRHFGSRDALPPARTPAPAGTMLSLAWRVSHVMLSAASRRRIISPGTPASARRFRAMHPAFSDAAIGRAARPGALPRGGGGGGKGGRGRAWCVTVRGAKGAAGSKAPKQRYLCQDCGEDYGQWHGQCPGCKAWESFTIFTVEPNPAGGGKGGGGGAGARALARAAADAPPMATSAITAASSHGLGSTDKALSSNSRANRVMSLQNDSRASRASKERSSILRLC